MIAALVPVKRLAEAKSRLAPRLSSEERTALVREMLDRTVWALRGSGVVDRVALATPEPDLAGSLGVELVADTGDLNGSLRRAAGWAEAGGAQGLLIVPADLPSITPEAIRSLIESSGDGPGLAVARTQDGGTGALLLMPPSLIPPAFGPDSFQRHLSLAARLRVPIHQITSGPLCFDLDTAEDLEAFQGMKRFV